MIRSFLKGHLQQINASKVSWTYTEGKFPNTSIFVFAIPAPYSYSFTGL